MRDWKEAVMVLVSANLLEAVELFGLLAAFLCGWVSILNVEDVHPTVIERVFVDVIANFARESQKR
jgi:hypothetical protein